MKPLLFYDTAFNPTRAAHCLERGETVCIPAQSDPTQLEDLFGAQDEMAAEFVRNGQVAERYRQK